MNNDRFPLALALLRAWCTENSLTRIALLDRAWREDERRSAKHYIPRATPGLGDFHV